MDASGTHGWSAAGLLLAIGIAAIVTVTALQVVRSPPTVDDRGGRPPVGRASPPTVLRRPATPGGADARRRNREQVAHARVFTRDWLDYLGGRREVSAVRGASHELKLTFAGGAPPALPVSGSDLGAVTCAPETPAGRVCTATAPGVGRFRFAMTAADSGGLQVSGVELD